MNTLYIVNALDSPW